MWATYLTDLSLLSHCMLSNEPNLLNNVFPSLPVVALHQQLLKERTRQTVKKKPGLAGHEPFLLANMLNTCLFTLYLPTVPCLVVFLHLFHLKPDETYVFRRNRVCYFDLHQSLNLHSNLPKQNFLNKQSRFRLNRAGVKALYVSHTLLFQHSLVLLTSDKYLSTHYDKWPHTKH